MENFVMIFICSVLLAGCSAQQEVSIETSPSPQVVEEATPSPTPSPSTKAWPTIKPISSPKASPKVSTTSNTTLINAQAELSCIYGSATFDPANDQPKVSAVYGKYGVTQRQMSDFGLVLHQNPSGSEAVAVRSKMSSICPGVPQS